VCANAAFRKFRILHPLDGSLHVDVKLKSEE
jgi:hypothetical protein